MAIPFLRLLERSKAGLVFENRFLAHGAPPHLPRFCGRDILADLREMDAQPYSAGADFGPPICYFVLRQLRGGPKPLSSKRSIKVIVKGGSLLC